jgi:hypothetical protein
MNQTEATAAANLQNGAPRRQPRQHAANPAMASVAASTGRSVHGHFFDRLQSVFIDGAANFAFCNLVAMANQRIRLGYAGSFVAY